MNAAKNCAPHNGLWKTENHFSSLYDMMFGLATRLLWLISYDLNNY